MCAPVAIPIVMGAIAAAGTATQYAGQQAAAGAQTKYQKDLYIYTRRSATANYLQQVGQIQNRVGQDYAQTSEQGMDSDLSAQAGKAKAQAAIGDRGVMGNSVMEALGEFDRIEHRNHTNLVTNLNWRRQQSYQDMLSARASAMDRINGVTPQPVQYPSALAAGLELGKTAVQTADVSMYATKTGPYDPSNANAPAAPLTGYKIG